MQDDNFKFEFRRSQINKIPKSKIVEELKRAAEIYGYKRFTRHEFDKVSKVCKGTTILNLFSKGGKTTFDNLQTLCYECNLGKGSG